MTVTSRIGFAMARDGALPFSVFLSKVDEKSKLPFRMIFAVLILVTSLCALLLISSLAFYAVITITVIGF